MSTYLYMAMIKKEYVTAKKHQIDMSFAFPDFPARSTQAMPDYMGNSSIREVKAVVSGDNRRLLTNPHLISYAKGCGRIESIFDRKDGSKEVKYATGFMIANDWIMTTALNIYEPQNNQFADRILFYPALGGNLENPVYEPITILEAYIQSSIIRVQPEDVNPLYNIAFLKIREDALTPGGYSGFRYQFTSYAREGVLLTGYPNDLPLDAEQNKKGTYMYSGMGKVVGESVIELNHNAATSSGYEGAPVLMNWGDGNGFVAIGINTGQSTASYNYGLRFNRVIYGAMKLLRQGGMDEVPYTQPVKPVNTAYTNIIDLTTKLRMLGALYIEYFKNENGEAPTIRQFFKGICNYLRHANYSGSLWAGALLDPINDIFIQHVKDNDINTFDFLKKYIGESPENSKHDDVRDSKNGVIDFAHLAATLEGYSGGTPSPNFWTGWGADLATGMAKVTEKINEMAIDASTYTITQIAYETIGAEKSPCNFSDFCSDFDAIKISLMLDELIDSRFDTENRANGAEFADLLEDYYTNHFQYRFGYVYSDLKCNLDVDLETLTSLIYNKMTGVDEGIGLLPTFGKSPAAPVIEACSKALAQYIIQEIGALSIDI